MKRQSEDLSDSIIEEETSDKLLKLGEETETEVNEAIALHSTSKEDINENRSCLDGNRAQDKHQSNVFIETQAEPLYHVLEEPGEHHDELFPGGNGDDRVKTASFYQSLRRGYHETTEYQNGARSGDFEQGCLEDMISSSSVLYQSLTSPNHNNVLTNMSNLTSDDNVTSTSPGIQRNLAITCP